MNFEKIDSVCFNVVSGGTPSRQNPAYYENGNIPWLKTGDIKKGFIYSVDEYITELGLENSSAKLLPINSILVAMYGDGNTAGNVAVNKIPLATNQACCNLIINPEKACYLYVYYYLKGSYVNLVNLKSGGSQQNLNAKTIKEFSIWIPELQIQQKIAAILSAYDDLIENNKQRIKLLENMAEELYKEWFVRFRFPNWQNTEFEKGVPKGWVEQLVSESFDVCGGGTPSKEVAEYWENGEINWFTPSDLTSRSTLFIEESELKCNDIGLNKSSAKIFPAYSVMMTSRATIGVLSINTTEACTNQGFITCRPNKEFPLCYLYHWLKMSKPYFEILASGATFAELSRGSFKKIKIYKPNVDIVEKFDAICKPIFDEVLTLQKQLDNLNTQKNSLLPRLISGKLSVQHLNIHYPPSMQ